MIGLCLTLQLFGATPVLGEIELGRVPSLWTVLTLGYLGAGVAMAWHLGRRGHSLGVTSSALACWPLLLGLVGRSPPSAEQRMNWDPSRPPTSPGPNAARIDACIARLAEGLAETIEAQGAELIGPTQLAKLGHALHRADARIARVDRLLRETEPQRAQVGDPSVDAAIAQLRGARDHAERELEAVLSGLLQLRVQLGLFALAGEGEPVRERLAELEGRVTALAELASVELAQVRS